MLDSGNLITCMLIILCFLAALDLWRQVAIKSENYWYLQYTSAVKSTYRFWNIGYRIEDLELKLEYQLNRSIDIKSTLDTLVQSSGISHFRKRSSDQNVDFIRESRIMMHGLISNDSSLYRIRCEKDGNLLRIGVNDFRTDSRDVCQIFTSTSSESYGPQNLFHLVPAVEGSFALKSVSNGNFIKAVPPPDDNKKLPWKLVIGGALVGSAEQFRLTEGGYLYSNIVDGFFTCASGQAVTGYEGKYGSYNRFILESVSSADIHHSYMLVDLSKKILKIQNKYALKAKKPIKETKKIVKEITGSDSPNPVRICLGIPMTSKGTSMSEVSESPFWTNLFDSFMKSIDWRSNRYIFRFYLGFDKADDLYDTGDAWSELREEFKHRATYRMTEQLMAEEDINKVLDKQLSLKLMHFDHLEGSPSQVVSQLMLTAYIDNFDYFYQVNDDTMIVSPNWAPKLVETLASNPSIPNFGVTGPSDTNNEKIFTHSFVHRTHLDVFGHLFPPYFKNWWSDDWISTVYGSDHTFLVPDVTIKHNVGAQKTKGTTRYEVDKAAQLHLDEELRKGYVQVDEWLKKNSLPRLSLPNICGYIPLVRFIAKPLLVNKKLGSSSSYSYKNSSISDSVVEEDLF